MNIEAKPTSVNNAEHYHWGDRCDGWHLLNRDDMSVIQERMPARTFEKMHYHKLSRQFFFVLDGTATMDVDGERIVLGEDQGDRNPSGGAYISCAMSLRRICRFLSSQFRKATKTDTNVDSVSVRSFSRE